MKNFITPLIILLSAICFSGTASASATTDPSSEPNATIDTRRDALRDSILSNIHGAAIPDREFDILKFGAKADGVKDCLPAFRKAIAKVEKAGGGRINVPAGTYLLRGPLTLTSNLCINLAEGAVIMFDPDPELYPIVNTSWEGTYLYNYSP